MFVNPRPAPEQLMAFYRDSPSTDYWANVFFPAVAEARRHLIFAPRARQVLDLVTQVSGLPDNVVDIGAGYGLFLEELAKLMPSANLRAIEPGLALAERCREIGFETFEGFAEEAATKPAWKGCADLVTSFEVIEHLPDPVGFVRTMHDLARPGGMVFFSGLCGDGFDIRTLGKRSNAVSPPHHLTFLSQQGVRALLNRAGLECVSFQTPGKLDVDIVRTAFQAGEEFAVDLKIREVILEGDEKARTELQDRLATECRSSHMWVLARRPGSPGECQN
jgi:SAM-dependent methyltransferase